MPKIQKSPYYAARRLLVAGPQGAWVLPSPAVEPAAGDRLMAGAPVGTSTGQIVQLKGQPSGAYYVEVRRPRGGNGWVLNTFVRLAPPAGAAVRLPGPRPATAPPRPTIKAAAPRTGKAPRPRRTVTPAQAVKRGDGEGLVRSIVENDKNTHGYLLEALYWRARGADNPALSQQLNAVVASYNTRQDKIRQSTLLKVSTGMRDKARRWWDALKALAPGLNGAAVGTPLVLPVVPILIAAAVASVATLALWQAFHQDHAQSKQDVENAVKLSEAYKKASPEGQQAMLDTAGTAFDAGTKAGEAAADTGFFAQLKNNALLVGAGIAGFVLLSKKK